MKSLSILIVEDNMGDARLIEELLKEANIGDYEVTYVVDTTDIKQIGTMKFDIILLDLHLGDMAPLESFKTIYKVFSKTPIVVLTGLEDDDLAAKIVRIGAQDYLIKGTFGPSTLRRTIRYSIERKKSQLRLNRVQKKSRQLQVQANDLEDETKRLEEVSKAKDVFLSIASHQLRTPATSVKQYLGMLLEGYGGPIPDDQKPFLETAYQSNERQLRIVEDLLKVAKLDAGYVTLHIERTDINNLLKCVIDDLAQAFAIRNQQIIFTPSETTEYVDIDADNMQMVFENLLDNASKYSNENAEIHVRAKMHRNHMHIQFEDNGIGIADADKTKLFQKFTRADSSFKYSPNGSGIGLYWAQEIVKLHKGDIKLDSKEGKGSTFTVILPHVQTNKQKAPRKAPSFSLSPGMSRAQYTGR